MKYVNNHSIKVGLEKATLASPIITAILITATLFNPGGVVEHSSTLSNDTGTFLETAKKIDFYSRAETLDKQTLTALKPIKTDHAKIAKFDKIKQGGRGGTSSEPSMPIVKLNESSPHYEDINDLLKPLGQSQPLSAVPAAVKPKLFPEYVAGKTYTCGGGYPAELCNLPLDATTDQWGMFNRECVSYVAFKVADSGRHMPNWGGRGNAKQWDDNAQHEGIPVDNNPQAGDVAIDNSGYEGHAMYVESVNPDGTINISQYNANRDGLFSVATISPQGLRFIHF